MEGRPRWYAEWEFWASIGLALAIFLPRLGDLSLYGEETRRGLIAREMVDVGDWIVPRQQGLPALFRPPLHNWAIAVTAWLRGGYDEVAVRLPSVMAIVMVVAIVYGFGRRTLARLGALAAAVSMATMVHVLQYGWLGETEAFYVLVVAGSMLAWRWLDATGRAKWTAWCAGYALAAAGMLTKGPQAPMLFVGGVGLFLLVERRWREVFTWHHAAGVATFAAIFATWEIPFFLRVGSDDAWIMLTGDVTARFAKNGAASFFTHLFEFPLGVFACLLPWGLFLLAYLSPTFRRALGNTRTEARFLACCALIGFVSCWLAPGARNRYFAPLHPCIALLVGLAVDRLTANARMPTRIWRYYFRGNALFVSACGIWVVGITLFDGRPERGGQPPIFAACYGVAALLAGRLVWRGASARQAMSWATAVIALGAFFGLTHAGAMVNTFVAQRRSMAIDVAQLRNQLPSGTRLVSIGEVAHNFAFYYGDVIPQYRDQESALDDPDWVYFCIGTEVDMPACDFPYTEVARVPSDPNCSIHPGKYVTIGRRERTATASTSHLAQRQHCFHQPRTND